jgi:1-acyl-sn-glycerol-3-phosphate acyltransferase
VPGFWGKLLYYLSKVIAFTFGRAYFRLRAVDQRNVPLRGPVMVCCNHISHLDPPLVCTSIPRLAQNMAKRELFNIKFLDWYMRTIGTVLVDRGKGKQALMTAIGYLRQGACILIFPEGTRSVTGQLGQGHNGAIVMAVRTGCSIVPAAIIGSNKAMRKGTKGIHSHPVSVRFGQPYKLDVVIDEEKIPREILDRECYLLMERIEALIPEEMRPTIEQKREWYGELAG